MALPPAVGSVTSDFRLTDLSGETIRVQAGNRIIYVHKALIAASSEFFRNVTKPEWTTHSKVIDLSNQCPEIFEIYCQWLYSKRLLSSKRPFSGNPQGNTWISFAKFYVLGEEIMDQAFQNVIVDAMIARSPFHMLDIQNRARLYCTGI
ncbi:BTB/POZ domain containing protein [Pyrenophora tritici-repentis]|nr:BTB/POZ domain containing protein [Pyrenophora tritici-repentis]